MKNMRIGIIAALGCLAGCDEGRALLTLEEALVEPVVHVETAPSAVGRCNGTHTVYALGSGSFISGSDGNLVALPESGTDIESLTRTASRMSFSIFSTDEVLECDGAVVSVNYGFANAPALVYPNPSSDDFYCIASSGTFREGLCVQPGPIGDWEERIEELRPGSRP